MTKTMTLEELKLSLIERKESGETWAGMAREYDVNPAVLWRIVHDGYNPRKKETRTKLHLLEILTQEARRDERTGRFQEREQR